MISVHPLPGTRPKASALESSVACRRNPMEARDALPHTLHTPRRLIPRRQPYRLTTALALLPFTASCSRHPSKKAPSPRPRTPNPHAHSSPFDMGASKRAVSNNGPAPPASISSHCSTTTRSAWASPCDADFCIVPHLSVAFSRRSRCVLSTPLTVPAIVTSRAGLPLNERGRWSLHCGHIRESPHITATEVTVVRGDRLAATPPPCPPWWARSSRLGPLGLPLADALAPAACSRGSDDEPALPCGRLAPLDAVVLFARSRLSLPEELEGPCEDESSRRQTGVRSICRSSTDGSLPDPPSAFARCCHRPTPAG